MKEALQMVGDALQASVRPLVTLALTFGLLWGFMEKLVSAEAFLGVVAMVLGFWFRERQELKAQQPPK